MTYAPILVNPVQPCNQMPQHPSAGSQHRRVAGGTTLLPSAEANVSVGPLTAGRSNANLLDAAKQVEERLPASVIGSTACSPIQVVYGTGYGYGDIPEQDRIEIEREANVAEGGFRAAFGNQPNFLDWRSAVLMTSLSDHLVQQAGRADLIVTNASTSSSFNDARQVRIGDLVMQAGRPVLLVLPVAVPFRMDRVVIGWKNPREAGCEVSDTLPTLRRASHVDVVEIVSQDDLGAARKRLDDLAGWLGPHGIAAAVHASTADAAAWLDTTAAARDASIVVAGAYGHSRARE